MELCRFNIIGVVSILMLCSLVVEAVLTQNQINKLQHIAGEIKRCSKSPGLSLFMLDRHKRTNYEYPEAGTGEENMSTSHGFCIGDGTRAFSAVLLGILIDNNENVTWDTPIEEILGTRTYLPDMYRTENLNLKDIFAMRSGLSGMDIVPYAEPYDEKELIRKLRYVPVAANFREEYVHNNILFSLVDKVSETLGGESWQNLMRKYILNNLQMNNTFFVGTSQSSSRKGKRIAEGVVYVGKEERRLGSTVYNGQEMVASASSMCTSSRDMYRWLAFLSDEGRINPGNEQLIQKETLEMLFQGVMPRGRDGNPMTEGYRSTDMHLPYTRTMNSLGFINGNYDGNEFVSQDGSLPGYQTLTTYIPDKKVGVHVAMLGDESPTTFAAKVLLNTVALDLLVRGDTWTSHQTVCSTLGQLASVYNKPILRDEPQPRSSKLPNSRDMKEYAHTYRNYAFGDVTVKYNITEHRDKLTLEYGKITYNLHPTDKNDTFRMFVAEEPFWYSTNANWYRENNKLFAVFAVAHVRVDEDNKGVEESEIEDDEEVRHFERIMNVTIANFDSHSNPVFARNARPPYYERKRRHDMECSAPRSLLNSSAIFVLGVFALLAGSFVC